MITVTSTATAAVLAGLGVLHLAWGEGSTFPYATRAELNDNVVGRQVSPSTPACRAVAALLGTAAGLVGVAGRGGGGPVARVGSLGVAAVLVARGAAGVAGRTDALVPGSTSASFRRRDRWLFGPLCLVLAAGAARAALSAR